jgi:hypothetical protein
MLTSLRFCRPALRLALDDALKRVPMFAIAITKTSDSASVSRNTQRVI